MWVRVPPPPPFFLQKVIAVRYLIALISILPVLLLSMNFNDLALFSYDLGDGYSFIASFGDLNGAGFGIKKEGFEFGMSAGNGAMFYTIFKSSKKLLIFSSESSWFVSAGSYFENFSYSSISLEKTPILGRFAVKMALLPRCGKADNECNKKRIEMEKYLDVLFNSSLLYRKVSSMKMGYSLGLLKLPKIPAFGFYRSGGDLIAGIGSTDGKSGWLFGISWDRRSFGLGGALSLNWRIFQADMGLSAGKNGTKTVFGLQIDLKGGKLFALLSEDGFEFYVF